jgi:UvrD-like helicase C-terminal domain
MLKNILTLDSFNRPAHWNLSENCRNYRIVGETAVRLSGFGETVYSGYMRTGGDIRSYDISFYEDESAQLNRLTCWLQELETQGYKTAEITLLSFRTDHLSAAARLKSAGYRLRPAWQSGKLTAYASVHAFKGMENKVIILTDIDLEDQDFHRHLFYTGITRATECVRVLCDKVDRTRSKISSASGIATCGWAGAADFGAAWGAVFCAGASGGVWASAWSETNPAEVAPLPMAMALSLLAVAFAPIETRAS